MVGSSSLFLYTVVGVSSHMVSFKLNTLSHSSTCFCINWSDIWWLMLVLNIYPENFCFRLNNNKKFGNVQQLCSMHYLRLSWQVCLSRSWGSFPVMSQPCSAIHIPLYHMASHHMLSHHIMLLLSSSFTTPQLSK